jgi:hypothetical protein
VSKKVRGPVRSARRRPQTRPAGSQPRQQSSPPSQLVAAEIIAEDVIEGEPSEAADELELVAKSTPARSRQRPGNLLAARAATEYVYVAQDMRRILVVAGALFATAIVLWLLLVVFRVIPVSFY